MIASDQARLIDRVVRVGGVGIVSLLVCLSGCASTSEPKQSEGVRDTHGKLITMVELDQLTKGFADRYMTLMVAACEALERDNPSAEQRRMAHLVKLVGVSSAYDIVTNSDPYTALLDLVLMVTLQSQIWIDDARADDVFKERADELVRRLPCARVEIWALAARVLTQPQLEVLDRLIWDWKHDNPEVSLVSFVRFSEFASSRGKSMIADVPKGTGLLAPLDEATRVADDMRLLAERGFYLSKRLPFLLNWQLEAHVNNLIAKPEVREQMQAISNLGQAATKIAAQGERLPREVAEERAKIFQEIDKRQKDFQSALGQSNQIVKSMQELAVVINEVTMNLNTAIDSTDRLFARFDKQSPAPATRASPRPATAPAHNVTHVANTLTSDAPPTPSPAGNTPTTQAAASAPAKPFDLEEYRRAAVDLANTAKELNQLVASTDKLVGSGAWTARLNEVNQATEQRVQQASRDSHDIVELIFQRTIAGAAIILVMAAVYRIFMMWLTRRALGGADQQSQSHLGGRRGL